MARFLFASITAWSHIDFGGRGFLRLAAELRSRGHSVEWLPCYRNDGPLPPIDAAIRATGVPILTLGRARTNRVEPDRLIFRRDLVLSDNAASFEERRQLQSDAVDESNALLAQHLRDRDVDVLIADRRNAAIDTAARLAGIPWAAMGTDGRDWFPGHFPEVGVRPRSGLGPASPCPGGIVPPVSEPPSEWLTSPYLNISFFFGGFWYDGEEWSHIPHAHHLGCERSRLRRAGRIRRVVVASGNTWSEDAEDAVAAAACDGELADFDIWFAASDSERAGRLAARRPAPNVRFTGWVDYETWFAEGVLAIGHGGTGIAWECMRRAIPLLAVHGEVGDQRFNAERIERLGIGRALATSSLGTVSLAGVIRALASDGDLYHRCLDVQQHRFVGGGVAAGATLVETLARTREPVVTCPTEPCCTARRPRQRHR